MASEDRNRFLDAEESDEEVNAGYSSEEELQKGGRSAKRRRIEAEESDDQDEESSDEEVDRSSRNQERESSRSARGEQHGEERTTKTDEANSDTKEKGEPKDKDANDKETKLEKKNKIDLPGVTKPLTKKNLVATEAAIKKSGVVYISRVPPFMTPAKLRSLLEPHGRLNRIFLTPEDDAARRRRVRAGGNKKRMFVDGWVEFVDKRRAKDAVALLNARPIGGKKGTYYRDDLWSLVYLRGFKWHNLTEQIAAENAERESRMRAEIAKSTRENKEFVRNVERARMLDGMQAKAEAKKRRLSGAEGGGMEKTADEVAAGSKRGAATALDAEVPLSAPDKKAKREKKMTFSQIPLAKKRDLEEEQPEHVKRVLSKIF